LIKRIDELEEKLNLQKEERSSQSFITGEVVSENPKEKKGFFGWIKDRFSFLD